MQAQNMRPCAWAAADPLMRKYHDEEWGVLSRDDRYLFEMLSLEGAQAGLSWQLILKKREAYRRAFHSFDIARCARMDESELEGIPGRYDIVRNRAKIRSVRSNAAEVLKLQKEYGSFADFLWDFTGGKPIIHAWTLEEQVPSESPLSETVSKVLKKRGFLFIGPVILYSFLQAAGLIDDHIITCPFHTVNRGKSEL